MNGPEHYKAAETFLSQIEVKTPIDRAHAIAAVAQVHATLAQAAATIELTFGLVHPEEQGPRTDWIEAVQ